MISQGLHALRRALFENGGFDKGSGIALHSTRNGCRMAKTSGLFDRTLSDALVSPSKCKWADAGHLAFGRFLQRLSKLMRERASGGVQGDQIHGPRSDRAKRMDYLPFTLRASKAREESLLAPVTTAGAALRKP